MKPVVLFIINVYMMAVLLNPGSGIPQEAASVIADGFVNAFTSSMQGPGTLTLEDREDASIVGARLLNAHGFPVKGQSTATGTVDTAGI